MSRIGAKPIALPEGVTLDIDGSNLVAKGPKGSLSLQVHPDFKVEQEDGTVTILRPSDSKAHRMLHGTVRAHVENIVQGVYQGFKKQLKMVGVGYRAQKKGNALVISAGYSEPKEVEIPEGLDVEVEKNTNITISGIDKHLVGEFAARVRSVRKPEPYQGKGIRYIDEHVRRKEGKTAK